MTTIPTQKEIQEAFSYDPAGYLRWQAPKARRVSINDIAGSVSGCGYRYVFFRGKNWLVHRLIWLYHKGYYPEQQLDHINGNRADNRIENLQLSSPSDNAKNKKKHSNNTSGVTGVVWNERDQRYYARINVNGKRIHIGTFTVFEDAIKARLNYEAQHGFTMRHGQ